MYVLVGAKVWEDKIMVTVSHDRTFLDAVCTDNLHLSGAAKRLTQVRNLTSHVCMHHSMHTWAAWGGVARMTFSHT